MFWFSCCNFSYTSGQSDSNACRHFICQEFQFDTAKYLTFLKLRRKYQWKTPASTCIWLQSIFHFKTECRKLNEELAQKTFFQKTNADFCYSAFVKTVGSFCGGSHLVNQMFGDDSNRKRTDFCSFSSMEVKDGFCLLEEKHFIAFEQVRGPLSWMSGEDLESQIKKTGKVG